MQGICTKFCVKAVNIFKCWKQLFAITLQRRFLSDVRLTFIALRNFYLVCSCVFGKDKWLKSGADLSYYKSHPRWTVPVISGKALHFKRVWAMKPHIKLDQAAQSNAHYEAFLSFFFFFISLLQSRISRFQLGIQTMLHVILLHFMHKSIPH